MRPGTQDSPRTLNLSQVVASVFHFRIVNTLPASLLIHFRNFSAWQLSEIMIVKRVSYNFNGRCHFELVDRIVSFFCVLTLQLRSSSPKSNCL